MTVLEQAAHIPEQLGGHPRPLAALVQEHLGVDPGTLPLLTRNFPDWKHVVLQAGLEGCASAPGRSARLVGVTAPAAGGLLGLVFKTPSVGVLLTMDGVGFGAAQYVRRPCGPNEEVTCLATGLLLLAGADGPVAVWVRSDGFGQVGIDVIAPSVEEAAAFLDDLERHMAERNPLRGKFLRLSLDGDGAVRIDFEPRPQVSRAEVILPDGVLEAIEAHGIGITARADQLVAAGRHLKRGLLFFGPPGTGKTHTLRYLASQLPQATLFVLTGTGMAWLPFIKDMIPKVAPAIVVLDDVDLIAEDRDLDGMSPRHMLFTLLDVMDGIGEDADVLFICTSNRPETLERAIAARPGRIDQAVEVGLPDATCRRRLLDLYCTGIECRLTDPDAIVDATEGVTASFIKELVRRAWRRWRPAMLV